MADNEFDRAISRDVDSALLARDGAAVREWVVSGRPFHAMNDHPKHLWPVMGGLWGSLTAFRPGGRSWAEHLRTEGLVLARKHFSRLDFPGLDPKAGAAAAARAQKVTDQVTPRREGGGVCRIGLSPLRGAEESGCWLSLVAPILTRRRCFSGRRSRGS